MPKEELLIPQIESSPWFFISIMCLLSLLLTWMKIYYL